MGLAGNLLRAVSPVSAVVMIVAGSVKREPLQIVKRTSVPMLVGVVAMFILSMVMFL
jgi:DcuC family C4-dicarboxylate transporter